MGADAMRSAGGADPFDFGIDFGNYMSGGAGSKPKPQNNPFM